MKNTLLCTIVLVLLSGCSGMSMKMGHRPAGHMGGVGDPISSEQDRNLFHPYMN